MVINDYISGRRSAVEAINTKSNKKKVSQIIIHHSVFVFTCILLYSYWSIVRIDMKHVFISEYMLQ